MSFVWGLSFFAVVKFFLGLTAVKSGDEAAMIQEGYFRLRTQFAKNKYGYNTRFMSDFDSFLEAVLNERFIEEATNYQDDEVVATEIEDMEAGLVGDFAKADIKNLLKDRGSHDHSVFKSLMHPDRVGTNYPKDDSLSCYKILPKHQ